MRGVMAKMKNSTRSICGCIDSHEEIMLVKITPMDGNKPYFVSYETNNKKMIKAYILMIDSIDHLVTPDQVYQAQVDWIVAHTNSNNFKKYAKMLSVVAKLTYPNAQDLPRLVTRCLKSLIVTHKDTEARQTLYNVASTPSLG